MTNVNANIEEAPGGGSIRRLRILDAAEALFAAGGFEGTSMRAIAQHADVDLALLAYHFGSKPELFSAVLARRANAVHHERLETLEAFRTHWKGAPPIEDLVDAFLRPVFRRAREDADWRNYLRLISRLSVQREWVEPISQLYDPTAKYFINAMRMAAPESSDEQLYWAYHFLLSALVFTGSDNRRIDALSHGQYHSADFDQAYPYLIMFVSSGIRGILYESGASKHQFETPSARATIDPR